MQLKKGEDGYRVFSTRSRFERRARGWTCSVIVESSCAVLSRQGSHNPSGSVVRSLHLPGLCPCDLDGH